MDQPRPARVVLVVAAALAAVLSLVVEQSQRRGPRWPISAQGGWPRPSRGSQPVSRKVRSLLQTHPRRQTCLAFAYLEGPHCMPTSRYVVLVLTAFVMRPPCRLMSASASSLLQLRRQILLSRRERSAHRARRGSVPVKTKISPAKQSSAPRGSSLAGMLGWSGRSVVHTSDASKTCEEQSQDGSSR